jgi:hypothetical protein
LGQISKTNQKDPISSLIFKRIEDSVRSQQEIGFAAKSDLDSVDGIPESLHPVPVFHPL